MSTIIQPRPKGASVLPRADQRSSASVPTASAPRCSQPPSLAASPALPLAFAPVIERRGEEYLVRAGKPVAWLTPKQFGSLFGLGPEAIRRKIGSDALPETLVEYNGPRRIRIRADAVEHFRQHWRTRRALGL